MKKETPNQYRKRLQNILSHKWLVPSDTPEEKEEILTSLRSKINKISLYQYRSCNKHTLYTFSKGQHTLVNPTLFNDPFDALPYCDSVAVKAGFNNLKVEKLREFIDILRVRDFSEDEIKEVGGSNDVVILKRISEIADDVLEQQIYSRFSELKEQLISNTLSFCSNKITDLRNGLRIACFSETYASPIMWGHYADSGKGFCVKYSCTPLCYLSFCPQCQKISTQCNDKGLLFLLPVIYGSNRMDCTHIISANFHNFVAAQLGLKTDWSKYDCLDSIKISCCKSRLWGYEREWRLILDNAQKLPNYYSVALFPMEALYLGPYISQEDKNFLLDIAANLKTDSGNKLPVYQMSVNWDAHEYKLTSYRVRIKR